jgi:4-amino-4-deoxy-L-arabinose transferase-like glycosyltransferase
MDDRRFRIVLAVLTLLGFGARLAYGLSADVPNGFGDDVWYHTVANGLVHGRGFSDPFNSLVHGAVTFGQGGTPIPTAFHLPLFPALLALFSAVGIDSYTAHQAVGCALGAGTVAVAGLIGRRVAGDRAGLTAAAIAAVFLPLVTRDALLMSESLYGLLIALALLATLRLRERPSARRALALGAVIGLATLTRTEAVLLVLLLAMPAILGGGRERRVANIALVCAAVTVICAPWCVRNSLQFDQPTLLTTGDGSILAGANLDSTYYGGQLLGTWDFGGLYKTQAGRHLDRNEAVQSDRWRREGIDYIGAHTSRLPVVLVARLLRTWDLYPIWPAERARFVFGYYRHIRVLEYVSQPMLIVVAALAIFGAVGLRRRGRPVWPFIAPVVLVTLVSLVGYGDPRFRQAADVALVVLAGVGVAGMKGRPWARLSR